MKYRESAGIPERSFDKKDRPAPFVQCQSHQAAFTFLGNILTDARGAGLLHGPRYSGKSVLIGQFVQESLPNAAVAIVDGTRLKATQLLSEILEQFGYGVELNSTDELLNMLRVIVVQQTRSHRAPVLIVKNISHMYPSTLCVLCKLASQMVHKQFALRIIIVGDRSFRRIIDAPGMGPVSNRLIGDFELKPMEMRETLAYLYARLRSLGVEQPDKIFSADVCAELHAVSGGWPGKLDEIALAIFDHGDSLPIRLEEIDHPDIRELFGDVTDSIEASSPVGPEWPKFIVTFSGETLQEFELANSRALIGRSGLSDVAIESDYVSRQHALLIRDRDAVVLIDLKSRNGTFVNSRRISSKVLRDSDIIMIGNHRIKLIYSGGNAGVQVEDPHTADTAAMKTVADARRAKSGDSRHFVAVDRYR